MFQPNQQIGPYRLLRRLGQGGFGEVWLADKPGGLIPTQFALKLPLWDASKCANNLKSTKPVGSYPQGASPDGLLDMSGNVWEWCQDIYSSDYYKTAPSQNPFNTISNNNNEIMRVVRGGSWNFDDPSYFRAAVQDGVNPIDWDNFVGFRCAFRPDSP